MVNNTLHTIPAEIIIIYLIAVNLLTFLLCSHDKKMAKKKKWRVPESVLFTFAAVGGSIGLLAGMYICHHKTKKPAFKYGIPVIIVMQLLFVVILLLRN